MTPTIIQKYSDLPTKKLKEKAIRIFNAWIRERDKGQPCISCGQFKQLQAGHYKSAGSFNHLRFNEDNVHGQCLRCNYFLQQSDTNYRQNLIKKIGEERVERLDRLAEQRGAQPTNRHFLLEIITKYSKPKKMKASEAREITERKVSPKIYEGIMENIERAAIQGQNFITSFADLDKSIILKLKVDGYKIKTKGTSGSAKIISW